ncbi:MAG: hypothetical protein KKH34_09225 [Candidatus Omnitrophica bacterium]|nr:hypothetical protein [Candidatus Omnitrophota bacterium]
MSTLKYENLDLICAREGRAIAENPSSDLENLITNALAVLEEQGVYALFLFLSTINGKNKKALAEQVSTKLQAFLQKTPKSGALIPKDAIIFDALQKMSENLDNLLLARDLLRQTLVYARYHAKCEVTP